MVPPRANVAWQISCGHWHPCHYWQNQDKHSVSAMTALIILIALLGAVLAAAAGSLRTVARDGYRPVPNRPDRPRFP
jgi:hypothetical protein